METLCRDRRGVSYFLEERIGKSYRHDKKIGLIMPIFDKIIIIFAQKIGQYMIGLSVVCCLKT